MHPVIDSHDIKIAKELAPYLEIGSQICRPTRMQYHKGTSMCLVRSKPPLLSYLEHYLK
jgi:hypothetical protein